MIEIRQIVQPVGVEQQETIIQVAEIGRPGAPGPAGPPGAPGSGASYSEVIGNGVLTTFVITHNLGTRAITVVARLTASPYDRVWFDDAATTLNTSTLAFDSPPATNEYTVTVTG